MASNASAQVPAGRPENPEADKFVAQGIDLRARGKDAEALRAFEKASEIDPDSVRVQIHLATVHQALGNWLLADEYLSLALSRQNHPYVNRHRKALEDAQKVINANIGRLEVEGEPVGAEVRLNGRLVGTLPLAAPVRATTGSYLLEVRFDGHYAARRPIAIPGGGLVREVVRLEPLTADERVRGAGSGVSPASSGEEVDRSGSRQWLTWTLVGATGAAAATTLGAMIFREVHAGHWNDNARCLELERTREEVCGDERDKAQAAGTLAVVAGVLTGVFAAGAAVSAFGVFEPASPVEAGLTGCSLGLGGASCFGSF